MNLTRTDTGLAVALPSGPPLPLRHIIGIGRNYAEHAKEQGAEVPDRPMYFTKNPFSAILSGDTIVIPKVCQDKEQVDYEGELAVIIGAAARDVEQSRALAHVLGYCVANDVSARWWQKQGSGGQFCRGKSFDTFCPLGPRVTPAKDIRDPQALKLETKLNGEVVQSASTGEMIFSIAYLIAELSKGTTLLPGTVILTGTPSGVGMSRTPPRYLKDGDEVSVSIEGLGEIRNRVKAE
jgi:2-keto-4-pentenoate hydratase/2-oxohepta-3-ene-1,7-dioic acid hydratase in catechol pathway